MTSFADIAGLLEPLAIEVPSWAYGNSGTRFKVFGSPGTPRTVQEKIADAATVHRHTGLAPSVALHIPWDRVDDYAALRAFAEEQEALVWRHLEVLEERAHLGLPASVHVRVLHRGLCCCQVHRSCLLAFAIVANVVLVLLIHFASENFETLSLLF